MKSGSLVKQLSQWPKAISFLYDIHPRLHLRSLGGRSTQLYKPFSKQPTCLISQLVAHFASLFAPAIRFCTARRRERRQLFSFDHAYEMHCCLLVPTEHSNSLTSISDLAETKIEERPQKFAFRNRWCHLQQVPTIVFVARKGIHCRVIFKTVLCPQCHLGWGRMVHTQRGWR